MTEMGLTLLPRYRVVLLSQRQVPKWDWGENPGINLMLSMQCWAWMSHPDILIYIWLACSQSQERQSAGADCQNGGS